MEPESIDKIQEIRGSLPDLEAVVVVESEETGIAASLPEGMHHLHQLLEQASSDDVSQATLAEDPAMIIFTSGTTGSPKGTPPLCHPPPSSLDSSCRVDVSTEVPCPHSV